MSSKSVGTKSFSRGKATSKATAKGITPFGVWLLVAGEELFLSFDAFPFFKQASIDEVLNVELHGTDHLHWPALDVDLELDSIRHPGRFPLVDKRGPVRRAPPR